MPKSLFLWLVVVFRGVGKINMNTLLLTAINLKLPVSKQMTTYIKSIRVKFKKNVIFSFLTVFVNPG